MVKPSDPLHFDDPAQVYRVDPQRTAWRAVGREAVVLDLDSGVYFGLNRTAGALWPALVAGATVPELVQALNADLPAPLAGDRGVAEVSAFLSAIAAENLLLSSEVER